MKKQYIIPELAVIKIQTQQMLATSVNDLNELSDEDRNAFMADVARVTRAMQKAFNPEKINYGVYSDKLSHLHFHLAPKYVDGPDYGGTFQMNPGKVYLSDAEYAEMIEKIKKYL